MKGFGIFNKPQIDDFLVKLQNKNIFARAAVMYFQILKELEIPEHFTYLPRNLYAGQEATVRTGYGTMDWFQIGKGVKQGCITVTLFI